MKWFKHNTDASTGISMQTMIEKEGISGYASWFLLLELYYKNLVLENGNKVRIHKKTLAQKLRKSSAKVEQWLNFCRSLQMVEFMSDGDIFEISVHNSLKYMNRDQKRIVDKRASTALKPRLDKTRLDYIKNNNIILNAEKEKSALLTRKDDNKKNTFIFIKSFCEVWKTRYGSNYKVTRKCSGIAKRISQEFSDRDFENETRYLVEAYLAMNDSWFITRTHDMATLEQNLQKVLIFAKSGKMITKSEALTLEKSSHSNPQLSDYEMQKLRLSGERNQNGRRILAHQEKTKG